MHHHRSTWIVSGHHLRRVGLVLVGVFVLLMAAASVPATEQESTTDLPVIEPRLTRIIGSDTLDIGLAVLSPDGRWVVYSTREPDGGRLWVVSTAGGTPTSLIESRDVDNPAWFPDGDRLAYRDGPAEAVMTVSFDRAKGVASGSPRRVTLDPVYRVQGFRLSPDGRWLAYKTQPGDGTPGGMLIRVIPSNGGTARTIASERTLRVFLQDWSADGRYVYYRRRNDEAPDSYLLLRAAVDGGTPELVDQVPGDASGPRIPYRVDPAGGNASDGPGHQIETLMREPVAMITLPDGARPAAGANGAGLSFSQDLSKLLTVVPHSVEPLRVLPVSGGASRQLGETGRWEKPLGWSADGKLIFYAAVIDGRTSIMSVPVAGGAAREIGPMPDLGPPRRDLWGYPIVFSADGRYISYSRPTPDTPHRTFLVRPAAGGGERVITQSLLHHEAFGLTGPGGAPLWSGEEFLYGESLGDGRYELRAVSPTGPSRLLPQGTQPGLILCMSVFEDRLACASGDVRAPEGLPREQQVSRILIANGPAGDLKEVAVLPGVWAFDDLVWSNDGRWIAANAYYGSDIKVVVVGVTEDGEVSVPHRVIDTPMYGAAWSLRWLPDDSAVVLYGQSLPDWGFDIWLVPVKNGGRPVALTRDETDYVGYHVLSPDGRYIAYQTSVFRGTSLWLADLGDALRRLAR